LASGAGATATANTYDARNRRTRTTFADNAFETQTFDANGNLKTLTDANTQATTYTYDARNRETKKAFAASADGLTAIDTQYDANGNVTQTKENYGAGLTRIRTRSYDAFNRLERETDPWSQGNAQASISRIYDAHEIRGCKA